MLFFILCLITFFGPAPIGKTTLTVDIQNVKSKTGKLYVALYEPCDGFPSKCKPVAGQALLASTNPARLTFSVEPGQYAIALYHDVNDNGKMDKGMFGIPKEPYGFSNNFRPKFAGPKFSDCQFEVKNEEKKVEIRLE
jgi:uncharacterized protein (DUF2141 family)